jgi:hypothetical protein
VPGVPFSAKFIDLKVGAILQSDMISPRDDDQFMRNPGFVQGIGGKF